MFFKLTFLSFSSLSPSSFPLSLFLPPCTPVCVYRGGGTHRFNSEQAQGLCPLSHLSPRRVIYKSNAHFFVRECERMFLPGAGHNRTSWRALACPAYPAIVSDTPFSFPLWQSYARMQGERCPTRTPCMAGDPHVPDLCTLICTDTCPSDPSSRAPLTSSPRGPLAPPRGPFNPFSQRPL